MAEKKSWKKNVMFNRQKGSTNPPLWPNEFMIKNFSSTAYSDVLNHINQKKKEIGNRNFRILEIGCFSANNLRFFHEKGLEIYGVEVSEDLCNVAKESLISLGIKDGNIKLGDNENLPFKNDFFDCIISINTIHYSAGKNIEIAFREWNRVLNDGAVVYLETVGPSHFVRQQSKKIGNLSYIWGYQDFRADQEFGFFDNEEHLNSELRKYFNDIGTGRRLEKFTFQTLDFLIGHGRVQK